MTFHIGQVVPAGQDWDRRAIFTDAPARWHALTVQSQREDQVEAWLSRRGVYAFHPIKSRKKRQRGKLVEYRQRYLPGYVFAKFPGVAIQHRVMGCPWITGAICLPDGQWGVLSPGDLRGIHAMRGTDDAKERARINARRINRGDRVRVLGGLAGEEGQVVEVLEISGEGRVKFKLRMFGAEVPGEAGLDRVVKVG